MSLFRRKPRCAHRWYATAVSPYMYKTTVLYVCPDCEGAKTIKLDGRYTTLREVAGYDVFDRSMVPSKVDAAMIEQAKQDLSAWTDETK